MNLSTFLSEILGLIFFKTVLGFAEGFVEKVIMMEWKLMIEGKEV